MLKQSVEGEKTSINAQIQTKAKNMGEITKTKELQENHRLIVDAYFNNGFNKSKAVIEVLGALKHQGQANHIFNGLSSLKVVKNYIEQKRLHLSSETNIYKEQILKERISLAFSDITDFIGLTEEELKNLPSEQRRQIQSYKVTERTETTRTGEEITTKTIDLKLIDKSDSLKEISKHIGFYEVDNRQKSNTINLEEATPTELNTVLKLMQDQLKRNRLKAAN